MYQVAGFWSPVLALAASNVALSANTTVAADTQVEGQREYSLLDDKFMISAGTFLLTTKTNVSINGTAGNIGTEIDTKKDLGFRDADRFRLDATWRFAEKHKIRAMYFSISQSNTRNIDHSITVGDTVYPVNASITAKNSTSVYELAYEYSFLHRDNYEITASAGLHAIDFGFSLKGNGTVNGQPVQGQHARRPASRRHCRCSACAGLWELAPNWYVDAQAQYFQLKIDNIDGRVTDLRAGVTWMFAKHWGLGAGYNRSSPRWA